MEEIRREKRQLLEKRLDYEENRRNNMYTRLTIPITLTTFIFGGFAFIFDNLKIIDHIFISRRDVIYFFLVISMLFLISGTFYLIKSLYGYTYEYFPLPSDYINDVDNLINYYKDEYYKTWSYIEIKKDLYKEIDNLHINYSINIGDANVNENDRRQGNIHKCLRNLTISGIILLIVITFTKYEGGKMSNKEIAPLSKPIAPSKPIPSGTRALRESYTPPTTLSDEKIRNESSDATVEDKTKEDK